MGNLGQDLTNLNHLGHQRASRKEARASAQVQAQQGSVLEQLLAEQRRTNQLLEWLGGVVASQGSRPPQP